MILPLAKWHRLSKNTGRFIIVPWKTTVKDGGHVYLALPLKMRLVLLTILRVQREAFVGNPPLGVAS